MTPCEQAEASGEALDALFPKGGFAVLWRESLHTPRGSRIEMLAAAFLFWSDVCEGVIT